MTKNLVIVESPAKAKTIEGFLGKDYLVKSSFGHVRDLSKKDLGIDIEHNFLPLYEVSADKIKIVKELKKLAKEAETVIQNPQQRVMNQDSPGTPAPMYSSPEHQPIHTHKRTRARTQALSSLQSIPSELVTLPMNVTTTCSVGKTSI